MCEKNMELLRETLCAMLISKPMNDAELLKKSQELDKLILKSMEKSNFARTVLGYEYVKEFNFILDMLQSYEKMYQAIRIVDPVKKMVLELKHSELYETNSTCYELWKKQAVCDNCISLKAYNEDDIFFKIEKNEEKLFMVIAVPISIQDRRLVVELLKDVTNNFV